MTLLVRLRAFLNKSPIFATVAQAYLVGYAVPLVTMVLPHFITPLVASIMYSVSATSSGTPAPPDFVQTVIDFYKDCLTNPVWLYVFFKGTLNSGIAFVVGALLKNNAFDKFKSYFPTQPSTPEPPK